MLSLELCSCAVLFAQAVQAVAEGGAQSLAQAAGSLLSSLSDRAKGVFYDPEKETTSVAEGVKGDKAERDLVA